MSKPRTDADVADLINDACRVDDIQFGPSMNELRRNYKFKNVILQRVIDGMIERGELIVASYNKRGGGRPVVRFMSARTKSK